MPSATSAWPPKSPDTAIDHHIPGGCRQGTFCSTQAHLAPVPKSSELWEAGKSHFRCPGSPSVTIELRSPINVAAGHCLAIAQELLEATATDGGHLPAETIYKAIKLGVYLPIILAWYDGQQKKCAIEAAERTARQAKNARAKSTLSDSQDAIVGQFVREKVDCGVSVSQACRQASAQLLTGTFLGIDARLDITADALRKKWPRWH